MAIPFDVAVRATVAEGQSHLGYREGPRSNENIFGAHYSWNFVAWCVQFAWYCGEVTGSGGGIPKTASTGAAMRWAKSVGRWRTTPQPGDWSIMVNSRGATIHTDLVESYDPGRKRLICIGGNTSGIFGGSVNEGNGVYRNNRWSRWKQDRIIGFVRPFYGVGYDDVELVQRLAGIKVDGIFGPATLNATKHLQRKHGLTADGFPGPSTIAALGGSNASAPATGGGTSATFADVDKTQRWLLELGLDPGPVDGIFGTRTEAATRQFQTDFGITPADGRPGPATRTHLEAAVTTLDNISKQITDLPRVMYDASIALAGINAGKRSTLRTTTAWTAHNHTQTHQLLAAQAGKIDGLVKAVEQLAAGRGIDPDEIQKAVAAGVDQALGSLEVTVTKGD